MPDKRRVMRILVCSQRYFVFLMTLNILFVLGIEKSVWAQKRQESPHALVEQMAKILVHIENRYVDPVERNRLLEGAIRGMVSELDPHSTYFSPKDFAEFTQETEGRFGGIGIEVDLSGEYMKIITPIEGGPAEAAGIQPGDEILEIDGKQIRATMVVKSLRKLRGTPGTKVHLTLRRPSEDQKLFKVTLVRQEIRIPSVRQDILPQNVAYIRIRQFQEQTHAEFVSAIQQLQSKLKGSIQGVVLDLRRNPGGLVHQAVRIADEFLDSGIIFSMRGHRNRTLEEIHATSGGNFVKTPTVVLIDEGSASAAELVAGALQDHRRAVVVGMNSFGKGSVQSILELPHESAIKLTTARYYTPKGHTIQSRGIKPDIQVESTRVVDSKSIKILKERDLPNALPAEATKVQEEQETLPSSTIQSSHDTRKVKETLSLRTKPVDLEQDFPLRIAHQIVVGLLMKL